MSRSYFQDWGVSLEDSRFACALAWLGTRSSRREEEEGSRFTLPWSFHDGNLSEQSAEDAAAEWDRAIASIPDCRIALEVHPTNTCSVKGFSKGIDTGWLIEMLARAPGVTSVSLAQEDSTQRPWDWPLDIAFFSDRASQALRAKLDPDPRFVRLVDANATDAAIDLLLFAGSLSDAVAASSNARRFAPVHTMLVLGGAGRSRDVYASLTALRKDVDAVASGVVDIAPTRAREWMDLLLAELSCDRALDEAIFTATKAHSRVSPILTAPRGAFGFARNAFVAHDKVRKLASRRLEAMVGSEPPELQELMSMASPTPLKKEPENLSRLSKALKKGPPAPDGRFVQAKAYCADRALADEPLQPGKVHRIDVRIARPDDQWALASDVFPEEKLPPNAAGHQLTIVFIAPSVFSEPQTALLWLPPNGDSAPCSFHFLVKENLAMLDGRVMVLYENRLLQTLRIRARVGERVVNEPTLSITVESVLRTRFDALGGLAGFDVSLMLNDLEDSRGIAAVAGSKVAYVSMSSNLGDMVKALRDELEEIKQSPEDFDEPRGEATRRLLVSLSRAGNSFLEGLRELPGMATVLSGIGETSSRIQVMSIHPDEVVPLEFVYDRGFLEEDATFCQGMAPGGVCGPECSRDERTICPQGFWGIRHVIERCFYDATVATELTTKGATFSIGAEVCEHHTALPPLRSVLFSSADRAANFDKISFQSTIHSIGQMLQEAKKRFVPVNEWDDWQTRVREMHPELLLLLPHTELRMGAGVMEIGKAKFLAAGQIKSGYVSEPPIEPPKPGPVVLLLGCRTAQEDVPFSNFVGAFRRARASVVIATLSTVRGRHMAPVAEEAVRMLIERTNGAASTIGDFVRDLRLRLLVKGLPVGLTLVAFGDVDWQLGGIQ